MTQNTMPARTGSAPYGVFFRDGWQPLGDTQPDNGRATMGRGQWLTANTRDQQPRTKEAAHMSDENERSVASDGSTLWVISRAWPFSAMTANGMEVKVDPGEPTRFMPVFDTREQAVKWYGTDDENIQPIKVC